MTEKIPRKLKGQHSKVYSIKSIAHSSNSLGSTNYDFKNLRITWVLFQTEASTEVGIQPGQDAYVRKNESSEDFADRHDKIINVRIGVYMTFLWCFLEHSKEEI